DTAQDQVCIDFVQGLVDVAGLVADDLYTYVSRELCDDPLQILLHRVDHLDGVGPGLPPDFQDHRRVVIQTRCSAWFLGAILRTADVPNADRRAVHRGNHQLVKIPWLDDASQGAQRLLACPCGDIPPWHVGVLAHHGITHRGDGDAIGGQARRIDPDVDGAF